MQTYTPVPATPASTQPDASLALRRLADSNEILNNELTRLPTAPQTLIDALHSQDKDRIKQTLSALLQQLDAYWQTPVASSQSRRELFATHLRTTLHDEATLKIHERELGADVMQCLPVASPEDPVSACSLHVKLDAETRVEIKGALVMSLETEHTLLSLPGSGLSEFVSVQAMLEGIAQWLNDKVLRRALLVNADQRDQHAFFSVAHDPDLFIEAFDATHVQLQFITTNPYEHAVERQLDKQREDLRYLCDEGLDADTQKHADQIEGAIQMAGLLGPSGMLERREDIWSEHTLRKQLPRWIKYAPSADRTEYARRLLRYEQANEVLSSALNGAASFDRFAEVSLRASLSSDLGYNLDPSAITVSTQRTLPVTGESYTVTRTLPQLALYGLHPGDGDDGSEFLNRTIIDIDGIRAEANHPLLTPAYTARLIDELKLRINFGEYQRKAYAKDTNQALMRDVLRAQVAASAYAAKMQGHLSPEDFDIVESIAKSSTHGNDGPLTVHQIRLKACGVLGRLLVFKKAPTQDSPQRLIMFMAEAPHDRLFQGFRSETQLLEALVEWTLLPDMSNYLVEQFQVHERPALKNLLDALNDKPHPEPDFIQLIALDSYDTGLHQCVGEFIGVTLSKLQIHTPDWFLQASEPDRQRLVALEDAAVGAQRNYETKAHTRIQDFETYVHVRACEKICQLLNVPVGTVDSDHIIITSERETLTYTQMMRNGYDDSLGLLTPTADTVATFTGPDDIDISVLTPGSVAGSVRGKWLGDAYIGLINDTLLNPQSSGYEYRRKASTLITGLQMQAAALRSFLKGHVDAAQYHWLAPSVENLSDNTPEMRARFPVYPLQIHVDKPLIGSRLEGIDQLVVSNTSLIHIETVQGCFAFLPTQIRLAPLLYTPKAPDGVEFRLFSSFTESLSQPGMIDYYKDRCRINSRRTLSFFLKDMQQGNANKAPFLPKESIQDVAQICFNRVIERRIRDVEETTTGRDDMLSDMIWNSVEIIATVLTLPFPPASFVVGATLSLHYSFKAVGALTGESADDVTAYLLYSWLNMAGAAGDLAVGMKGFGGMVRKLGKDSKKGALPPALTSPSAPAAPKALYPFGLEDETLLLGKPNINGQAQIYRRTDIGSDTVHATGRYAARDDSGTWQPLGQSTLGSDGVNAYRAVNISLNDLPRITEGHAKGVSLGMGRHYIEMEGLVYQVHYDVDIRCWNIVDPENPYAFSGRQPVRLNEGGEWQLVKRTGLRGGGKLDPVSYRPLPDETQGATAAGTNLHDYELPHALQAHMDKILDTRPLEGFGMGLDEFFEAFYIEMRVAYGRLRQRLYQDAGDFFAQSPTLPPRPELPTIDAGTNTSSFLKSVFATGNGLVLSEAPKSIASKRLLITHMQTLVEQRVEVIYLPQLFTDKHMTKLAKYRDKGRNIRSGSHEIKHHLKFINDGALDNLNREYDYYHLIKQAHKHGIEIRPLSSSVSYPVTAHPVASAAGDSTAAEKMSNFFAHKMISSDVAADPSKRWVALVEQKLATTHDQIPGIAELQGVISVHIDDAPTGVPTRISVSRDLVEIDAGSTPSDFKLELADASLPEPAVAPAPENALPVSVTPVADNTRPVETGFKWDEVSGWQRIAPDEWTMPSPPTALQQSLADAAYEMPMEFRDALHELAYTRPKGLDTRYFQLDEELMATQERFSRLRGRLRNDANRASFGELAARPVMPVIEPQPTTAEFIERLYQQTDAMIVGEYHASVGSKKLLIDNMPILVQQNVKTLYMEHLLTDLHQLDLDRFFETGHMSKRLLSSLKRLDNGHMTDPAKIYTFEKLVLTARQHGLEIRAIDCAASYYLKGVEMDTLTARQEMMSFFASRTIRRHQDVIGKHKWVALVGNSHSNTYMDSVPGIAELEGGIGVRVVDVAPGTSRGITLDPGENVRIHLLKHKAFLKGDFRIEMEIRRAATPIQAPHPLPMELRLARPGMFVTEQEPDNLHYIIHRSRDLTIHRTPVQINADGKVYVDRPTWATIHLIPYENIDELISALEEINLTRVG